MAYRIGGLSIDSWLEHWLPGKELNLDNLPTEFANKRFNFRDLVFDGKHSGNIEYEKQMYPILVCVPPFSGLV